MYRPRLQARHLYFRIQSIALFLSSLLLKAILDNHVAFSEASKAAKNTVTYFKLKVNELELEKG
jgi:hypothetical protein